MILHDCTILTMDPRMPTASALAIAGGRIIGGVDAREDPIASQAHERVGLGGCTVVPGFVDSHVHFAGWALARELLNLRSAATHDDLVELVEAAAANLPATEWIRGLGWDELQVGPAGLPEDLGARLNHAAGGRPLVLVARDGHSLLANSAAVAAAGCSDAIHSDQLPLLREADAWTLRAAVPQPELTNATMARGMRDAVQRGVTCVHDMDGAPALARWRALEAERGLRLRVFQHIGVDELDAAAAVGIDAGFGNEKLRVAAVKAFADGTLSSGTAWTEPPAAGGQGQILLDEAEIQQLAERALAAGLPLTVHAIGDGATAAAVRAIVASGQTAPELAHRPRIEHAQLMTDEAINACAAHGIGVSIQPTHLNADLPGAESRWGDRLQRAYPWAAMAAAGVPLVLGSDAPIEELDPLAAFRTAVRPPTAGRDNWPDIALDPGTALAGMTSVPHMLTGTGTELGVLSKGYRADLVVLSDNPLENPDAEVVATMVGGSFVHGRAALSLA